MKTHELKFHFQHPPTSKISQLSNPKICERKKPEKFTTFLFRSTAVGLLCSYIVSRNQKTENITRKTPDLTAQKLADKMKKTEENNKSPDKQFLPICVILT